MSTLHPPTGTTSSHDGTKKTLAAKCRTYFHVVRPGGDATDPLRLDSDDSESDPAKRETGDPESHRTVRVARHSHGLYLIHRVRVH